MAKQPVRPIRSSVWTIRQPGWGLIVKAVAKRSDRLTVQAVAPLVEKPSVARRVDLPSRWPVRVSGAR